MYHKTSDDAFHFLNQSYLYISMIHDLGVAFELETTIFKVTSRIRYMAIGRQTRLFPELPIFDSNSANRCPANGYAWSLICCRINSNSTFIYIFNRIGIVINQ